VMHGFDSGTAQSRDGKHPVDIATMRTEDRFRLLNL
jgi:hypothetical protein